MQVLLFAPQTSSLHSCWVEQACQLKTLTRPLHSRDESSPLCHLLATCTGLSRSCALSRDPTTVSVRPQWGRGPGASGAGGRGGGGRGEKTRLPSRREGRMAQRRRARGQREQGSVRGCGWKSRRSGHKTPDSGADARSAAGPPEKRQHREPVPRPEPSTPRDGPQEPPAEPAAGAPSVSGPPGLRQAPAK